jgi:hypothetical protein
MTHSRAWLSTAAVFALLFGLNFPDPNLTGEPSPLPYDWLAAGETQGKDQTQVQSEENADESAKMGEDSGTKTNDGAETPENDTKKVDQPPTQNPNTSN